MDRELVQKLWQHTDRVDASNADRFSEQEFRLLDQHVAKGEPIQMPSIMFLDDPAQDLYMSFHHEKSNQLIHYHDFFELIYICDGSPIGVIDGQELVLQPGSLCVMNPNASHYFKSFSEETDLVLNIVLAKGIFQKSLFRILFNDPVLNAFFIRYQLENESQSSFLFLPQLNSEVDYLIESLLREYLDQRRYSRVITESFLTLIFAQIVRAYTEKAHPGNPDLAHILNEIYQNYQTVKLASLAEKFSYHPKYLSSIIRRHTGQTFRSLLTNIRLQNAANYLLYSNLSIEKIAEAVGYKERSSFHSAFRRTYKTSPAQYRLDHQMDVQPPDVLSNP